MNKTNPKVVSSISEEEKRQHADLWVHSSVNAARAIYALNCDEKDYLTTPDVLGVVLDKAKQFEENPNSSSMLENMLLNQINTLEALFTKATINTAMAATIPQLQSWSSIALKAQDQCRKTILALIEAKNPRPTVFIKQQNQALNQQVNNYSEPEKTENLQIKIENELFNEVPHATLDIRRKSQTSSADSQLETLAKSRSKNRSRQSY